MTVELRKDLDEYLQERLCKIPSASPISVIIKEIIESPIDSEAAAIKKEQTMPAIKGFTPLVLALPTTVKPSLGFSQKGTPIVLAIRCLDPLVLPRSIQGISRALGPKALEDALPSVVIIGPKMFSPTPNLQTQEGVVIRMQSLSFTRIAIMSHGSTI